MNKNIIALILLFVCSAATAQDGKIYYDKYWRNVSKKRKARWYRLCVQEGGIYKVEDHYKDGTLYMTGYSASNTSASCKYREGWHVFYGQDGLKKREGNYKSGIRTGLWKTYYESTGSLQSEQSYTDDTERLVYNVSYDEVTHKVNARTIYVTPFKIQHWQYSGTDSAYYEDNIVDSAGYWITTTTYSDHITVRKEKLGLNPEAPGYMKPEVTCYNKSFEKIKCDSPKSSKSSFTYVEQMPSPGYSYTEYLTKTFQYPKVARENNIEGRVVVKFVVDEDGSIANARVVKSVDNSLDAEALRVISEMPHWRPGMQNGVTVRVFFKLPIVFRLQ
jgi:TonB family protein